MDYSTVHFPNGGEIEDEISDGKAIRFYTEEDKIMRISFYISRD
jgi:hypothetical protein